jgi:short-subunit dehydrogenase
MKRWLALAAGTAAAATMLRRHRGPNVTDYFEQRACVVTGGGSGIGLEIVTQLLSHGARVLAVDISGERLAELRARWANLHTLQLDLTAATAPAELLAAAQRDLGGIQTMFNNAGYGVVGPFLDNSDLHIQRMVDLNFTAHVRMARHILPAMIAAGGGDMNFTVSLASWVSAPTLVVYSGTKGGLKNFAYALSREVSGAGIRVSGLHPNIVRTNLFASDVFDQAVMKYGPSEVVSALLRGVVAGKRDIFVNFEDRVLQRLEQLAPSLIDRYLAGRPDAQALLQQGKAIEGASGAGSGEPPA